MTLETIQVKVHKPIVGDTLIAQTRLLQERDDLQRQLDGLLEDEDVSVIDGLKTMLAGVAKDLAELDAANTVTIDVQMATFGGRLRQIEMLEWVKTWSQAARIASLRLGPDGDAPTDDELDKIPLTGKQREDYIVMASASAIVGAVCRDDEGRPVVANFDWPIDHYGWTQVPNYIFEPVLWAAYTLNPSWAPGWEGEQGKNG